MNYLGYRWWRLYRDDSGLHLHSLVQQTDWNLHGVTVARHHGYFPGSIPREHTAPERHCQCGLYAWQHLPDAVHGAWSRYGRASTWIPDDEDQTLVAGAVLTGGLVCLHADQGLRAQQARPVAFAVADRRKVHPLIRAVANTVGVPVFTYDNLERYCGEYGDRQRA